LPETLYIIFIFAAFLSSLSSYRLDTAHYKVIAAITAADLLLEIGANILALYHKSNIVVYNIALLLGFGAYALYFMLILDYRWARVFIRCYLLALCVFWSISSLWYPGINHWNPYFSVFGSLSTVFLSIVYYHQMFSAPFLVPLRTSFEFWVATALILFFACALPYFGLLHYLTPIFRPLIKRGIGPLQLINIIFYSIITYAFLCRINTRKSLPSSSRGS